MDHRNVRVTLSPQAIIMVLGTILGVWFVFQVRDIIILFLIVLAITVIFAPIVKAWERFIPRTAAILLLYILVFTLFVLIMALFLPPLLNQLIDFIGYLQRNYFDASTASASLLDQIRDSVSLFADGQGEQAFSDLLTKFQGSLGAVFSTTVGFIGGLVALVTIFISSFYLLLEENNFDHFLSNFLPLERRKQVLSIVEKMSVKMGNWFRGQLSLMVIVGVVDGIGLAIIGVPYPLLLGLWSGLAEALPVVGPILGGAPAVILAFALFGWVKALIVLVLYLLVQQVENHILVPKIMGRALGLSPVTIIFSVLIMGKLLGFLGIVIAVPLVAVLSVLFEAWKTEVAKGKA